MIEPVEGRNEIIRSVIVVAREVKKQRFGIVPRPRTEAAPTDTHSRHIPAAIKRAVYERDGGRCIFVDDRGNRCPETGRLEFDHADGFARVHHHDVSAIRLLCRAHNQHAAEKMYGRAFMAAARRSEISSH